MSRFVKYRNKVRLYIWNHLVCLDQWINVWLGGDPDETLSSRMGKRPHESCGICHFLCKWLNVFEQDHCNKAVERDRGRRTVIK